jgi:Tfp pilus assembly protein PilO
VSRTRLIVVGGSFALIVLAAVAWLFVLSPRFDQPGEIAAQTESIQDQTARLDSEIVQLTALQEELPARIERFDALKASFPTTAEIPAFLDQIRAAAAQTGVTVQALETSPPTLLAPAAAAATTDGTTPAPADAAAPPADPAAATPTPAADGSVGIAAAGATDGSLASMPMSVTVNGAYANLVAFLAALEDLPRAWLIDSIKAQGGQEGGAAITLTASGSMFVLDTSGIALPPSAPAA